MAEPFNGGPPLAIQPPDAVSIPGFQSRQSTTFTSPPEFNQQKGAPRHFNHGSRSQPGLARPGSLPLNLPALVVSVRSWLAALRGNSFSFLPLRFRHPVAVASSSARSRDRFQGAGPAGPSPLLLPTKRLPVREPLLPPPTVKLGPVLSADPSNTEAAITHSG